MTIQKQTVVGQGVGTVNLTNWPYSTISSNHTVHGEFTIAGVPHRREYILGPWEIQKPLGGTLLTIRPDVADTNWIVELRSPMPVGNLAELTICKLADGSFSFQGDDDVVFLGQDVATETVNITGLRVELETLNVLFNKALSTNSSQTAAEYIKLKNLFL